MKKLWLSILFSTLLYSNAWAAYGSGAFGDGGSGGGGSGTPGGSDTQVQYNNSGSFGGDAGLTYNDSTNVLTAGSFVSSDATNTLYSSDGIVTIGGVGGTNNESLALDFESSSNQVNLSSVTGLTDIRVGDLVLEGGDYLTERGAYGVKIGGSVSEGFVIFQSNTPAVTMLTIRLDDVLDQVVFTPAATRGNQIIIGPTANNKDFDHAQGTDPALYIQSIKDPDVSNNQWGSIVHNGTYLQVTTGANTGAGTSPTTNDNGIAFYPRGTLSVLMDGSGGLIPKQVTADPCGTMGEGSIFYNNTSHYMCYCNGTDDVKMADDTTACF